MILRSPAAGPRRVPRRLFAAAAVALAGVLAGCEAGYHAPTQQWHQPTDGAGVEVHGISIRNVFILGAAPAGQLQAGGDAGMFLALVNNTGRQDKLTNINASDAAALVQLPNDSPVILPPHSSVLLTGPEPQVLLRDLNKAIPGGSWFNVTLTFQNAGDVELSVPVMPASFSYGTFSPAPTPTPTPPTPTPTVTATPGHHKHKHKPGASATPTPSPSTT
ncbi:MAG TPA: copper chaperone PCu(A)C [Streptosporangiaceae bacterium]|nr:copper chaperone PCu(A)C [Streptosporangiaceae bacterium]